MTLKATEVRKMCEKAKEDLRLKAIEDAKFIREKWDSLIEKAAKEGWEYRIFNRPDNCDVWDHLWKGLRADGFNVELMGECVSDTVKVSW